MTKPSGVSRTQRRMGTKGKKTWSAARERWQKTAGQPGHSRSIHNYGVQNGYVPPCFICKDRNNHYGKPHSRVMRDGKTRASLFEKKSRLELQELADIAGIESKRSWTRADFISRLINVEPA